MKRRYLYILLFGVPALLVAILISLFLFGAAAGVLWIFVFGDNPWPASAEKMLAAVFFVGCLALWIAFMSIAFIAGKKQEAYTSLNAKHVMASAGTTVLIILVMVLHQWSVGNIGARSDSALCSEFCVEKGFAGSGMPPRDAGTPTCSCFDAQGRETVKLPMRDVAAGRGH
jgi:hypothetical protein